MNKIILYLLLTIFATSLSFAAIGTKAGTVLTNYSTIYDAVGSNFIMDTSLTMGSVFGLNGIRSGTTYSGYPGYTVGIDLYITNMGNDADNDARVFISSFSNSIGYSNSVWNYHFESAAVNVGTNYSVPFALFGSGAILHIVLVLQVPLDAEIGTMGFFTIGALTLSNSNHIAAMYTGYNGWNYGGKQNIGTSFSVTVKSPNSIVAAYASDGIDTIYKLNGTVSLRKIENAIFVRLANMPIVATNVNLWFAVDSIADGTGGNPADQKVPMADLSFDTYKAIIHESSLKSGNFLSFMIDIGGVKMQSNFTYLLKGMYDQGYETVIMNNLIPPGSVFLKLPESALGEEGKLSIYSIAGDLVRHVYEGRFDEQIYTWDGTDDQGMMVKSGMYFFVVDSAKLKEVRKVWVK